MPQPAARDRFLDLLRAALQAGALVKLTLGKPREPRADPTLRNLFVRPVSLKSGPHLAFVWRHATRDVTKNHTAAESLSLLEPLLGPVFLDAHLFTATEHAQLESQPDGTARLKISRLATQASAASPASAASTSSATSPRLPTGIAHPAHDRPKSHLIPADAPWLRALGITNDRGQPREGMADKFRQIQKFAELLTHLLAEAFPTHASPATCHVLRDKSRDTSAPVSPAAPAIPAASAAPAASSAPAAPAPLRVVDMGSGKGYLTFALAHVLGERAHVRGIEVRPELVDLCNRIAREHALDSRLTFSAGTIADTPLAPGECDVLIALHACDTATDDALARGIAAGAQLLVVAPCCQKELRHQLTAPPILAPALRHGIFQERQAEFVTDALRAQLLECVGFRTKVFEFISTEHTAKNLMIAAIRSRADATPDAVVSERLRDFATFYGIKHQRLAAHLHVPLSGT